jgi:hypothetical protein
VPALTKTHGGLNAGALDRLTANLSLFHYDYQDAQLPSTVRDPVSNINESRFRHHRRLTYYSVFNRVHNLAPSYDETDFRIVWQEAKNAYTIIAFVKNAFDDEGYEAASGSMSAWGVQSRSYTLTSPRTGN